MSFFPVILIAALLATASDRSAEISAAAIAHYDSLLAGKAVSWQIDVKRCPTVFGGEIQIVRVEDSERAIPRGTRLCWVAAKVDGRERRIPVTLIVKPMEWLPVAAREITPRETVGDSLVHWSLMESTTLGAAALPESAAIGKTRARARIPAGEIITASRLEPLPELRIGDQVTLIGGKGLVEVRAAGKALEDGQLGERITVLNIASNRRLRGTVRAGGLVYVE